ncbi:hypothetical protein [Leucobacter komagatae]|uniref:Lipoprotein antigen n=1 Tax=Leucobacter komagatae TaxID=55969 RepID=A0A0D0IMS9_9MICO|nr:hypothetical protein [Leucobacter komagatae]KIP52884.1 hypothetical protein SD72_06810 [Leucobacter komagatae]
MISTTSARVSAIGLACVGALALMGCAPQAGGETPGSADQSEQSEQSAKAKSKTEPAVGPAPLVEITFELEGVEHTVSGTPDRSFCDAGPTHMFTSSDPLTDAGVSAAKDGGEQASIMAWATGEFAVSFQGAGEVVRTETATGDTVWANDASGDAWVAPAGDLAGGRVSQSDLTSFEQVEATASFTMTCDPEGSE